MAIDFADIEGIDDAEKEQDEIETGADFKPRLHNKDKERMADANVPFDLVHCDQKFSDPEKARPGFKKAKPDDYYWECRGACANPLIFDAIPGKDGRAEHLEFEAGEEFGFTLSGIAKREPVMRKLFDQLTMKHTVANVCFTILEFTSGGQPILSITKWTEGKKQSGVSQGAASRA